jgi:hypothetical protein
MDWNRGYFAGQRWSTGNARGGNGRTLAQATSDATGGYNPPSFKSGALNVPFTGNSTADTSVNAFGSAVNTNCTITGNALVDNGTVTPQTLQWATATTNGLGRAADAAFTIEFFVKWVSTQNSTAPFTVRWRIGNPTLQMQVSFGLYGNAGGLSGDATNQCGTATLTSGVWTHVAICRPAGAGVQAATIWMAGTLVGTVNISNGSATGGYVTFGRHTVSGAQNYQVRSLRLTNDAALYTGAFTPPSEPLS